MQRLLRRIVAVFADGFFILLPVLITYLMLGQLFDLLLVLTTPITDVLPLGLFAETWTHRLAVVALLLLLFILVGLAAQTALVQRGGAWFERVFLARFPPYTVLKSLSMRIGGKESPERFQPALLVLSPDVRMLVAIVEELPDGTMTVFVPVTSAPGVGVLQIVNSQKVQKLECSMTDALGWLLNWGVGTEALFRQRR